MKDKIVSVIMLALLLIGMLTLMFSTQPVGANTDVKTIVYIDPPLSLAKPGETFAVDLMIKDAPHETHEPVEVNDKTFSWEFFLKWDPAILECISLVEGTWFKTFKSWWWDPDSEEWQYAYYDTMFAKHIENATGKAMAWQGLVGPRLPSFPTNTLVPSKSGWPDEHLHLGSYYDLPYTVEPVGEKSLARVRFLVKNNGSTSLHFDETRLWVLGDARTLYNHFFEDGYFTTSSDSTPPQTQARYRDHETRNEDGPSEADLNTSSETGDELSKSYLELQSDYHRLLGFNYLFIITTILFISTTAYLTIRKSIIKTEATTT